MNLGQYLNTETEFVFFFFPFLYILLQMPEKSNTLKIEKFICVLFPINYKWLLEIKSDEEFSILLRENCFSFSSYLNPHSSGILTKEVILKS